MDDNFFERVYTVVRQIPEGRVTAYGAIARKIVPPKCPHGGLGDECRTYPRRCSWHRVVNRQGLLTETPLRRD